MPARAGTSAGRQAAVLFAASGALALVASLLPDAAGWALVLVGLVDIALAVFSWLVPWHRYPTQATVVLAFLALGIIAVADRYGASTPYTYPLFFLVLFVWVGVWHPPRTSLALAPFALGAYLAPLLTHDDAPVALTSALVAVPLCVLVAEVIARATAGLRRAEQESAHRADLLAAVAATTHTMGALSTSEVLDAVSEAVLGIGFDAAGIVLFDEDEETFSVAAHHGLPPEYTVAAHPLSTGMPALVRARGATVVVNDYPRYREALPAMRDAGFRSVVAVPIHVQGQLGAVLIAAARRRFSLGPEDIEAAEVLGRQAGWALDNAANREEERRVGAALARASVTDPLTGTGNRRHADALLTGLRPGDAVLLLDLDHFKQVNDTHGHRTGDDVLVALGRYLAGQVRNGDDVARWGGEEFLVVLRQVGEHAEAAASRLGDGWRSLGPLTTFSGGVVSHHAGRTPADTLALADAALYTAKRSGRDLVVAGTRVDGERRTLLRRSPPFTAERCASGSRSHSGGA